MPCQQQLRLHTSKAATAPDTPDERCADARASMQDVWARRRWFLWHSTVAVRFSPALFALCRSPSSLCVQLSTTVKQRESCCACLPAPSLCATCTALDG